MNCLIKFIVLTSLQRIIYIISIELWQGLHSSCTYKIAIYVIKSMYPYK